MQKLAYNFHLNSEKSYFEKETKCFLSKFTFDGTVIVDKGKHQPFIIYLFLFEILKLRTHFSMAVRTICETILNGWNIRFSSVRSHGYA